MAPRRHSPTKPSVSGHVEIGRCKQCGRPVTQENRVKGPVGLYCSDVCREQHEAFVKKAQELDERPVGRGAPLLTRLAIRLQGLIRQILVLFLVLLLGAAAAAYFGYDIPFITPIGELLLGLLGGE